MDRCQHCRAATVLSEALADAACRPYSSNEESAARYLHVFGLTNWTFWVTALALIAFGFNLRVIYEQWRFWKIRKRPDEEIRELTQRLRTATERLNKANADAASKSRLRR